MSNTGGEPRRHNGAYFQRHRTSIYWWVARGDQPPQNGRVISVAPGAPVVPAAAQTTSTVVVPRAAQVVTAEPDLDERTSETVDEDRPWVVIVWNDPINLMSYVSFVFQKLFGYTKERADTLMLAVHEDGRAVVSSGPREKAEIDVFRLHEHGLWATMQRDDQ